MEFPVLLRLIDDRSTAFRTAIAAAPSLDAPVPTCPEWTLQDLVHHLGNGQRRWAAIVAAGPADDRPDVAESEPPAGDLLDWWSESTEHLLNALRAAGPDRGCWTWWARSQSPRTSAAVARHRLQEIAVHTYDAEATVDTPHPLPTEVALDGVEEFLFTCNAGPYRWPHEPATVDYRTTEGRSWRLTLAADGVRAASTDARTGADASLTGTASDLVLALYGRIPVTSLKPEGATQVFDQLLAWDPDA